MTIIPTSSLDSEAVYGALAEAIDRAGPAHEMLLLTRLALLLGVQCPSEAAFMATLSAAEHELQTHLPVAPL